MAVIPKAVVDISANCESIYKVKSVPSLWFMSDMIPLTYS
jgi:hypothetical protein